MTAFIADTHIAPSGVEIRTVDVTIDGVAAQALYDALYFPLSKAFDLRVRDEKILRIEWTDARGISTHDLVFLLPDILRVAARASLITEREFRKILVNL